MSKEENNLGNLQYFLGLFVRREVDSVTLKDFLDSKEVYMSQSQLPDLWTKTRTPFDKNIVFYVKKFRARKSWGGGKEGFRPNIFPMKPLLIPNEPAIQDSEVKLKSIEVDKLFETDLGRNFLCKEDLLMDSFLDKQWCISFFQDGKNANYGPLDSDKILQFLTQMYKPLNSEEKEKKNFMIVEILSDVYFQPDTLFEILSEEKRKRGERRKENIPIKSLLIMEPKEKDRSYSKFDLSFRKGSNASTSSGLSNENTGYRKRYKKAKGGYPYKKTTLIK